MILVGSRALELRAPGLLKRKPLDFDFICDDDNEAIRFAAGKNLTCESSIGGHKLISDGHDKLELDVPDPGSSTSEFAKLVKIDSCTKWTSLGLVPSLDALFLLKTSHRYKKNSPHFWKTLSDWHLLRALGAKIRPDWLPVLKKREQETYNYKHPSLNRTKAEFFSESDGIAYVYDHDSIHEAVALDGEPAYRRFQKAGQEVAADRDKFFACDERVRVNSVLEETAVLAIERSLVPHPGVLTVEQAWRLAFSKVCTSITSGWWRQWAYENAPAILKQYPADYYDRFKRGLESDVVKGHK